MTPDNDVDGTLGLMVIKTLEARWTDIDRAANRRHQVY